MLLQLVGIGSQLNQRRDLGLARQLGVINGVLALSRQNQKVGETLKLTVKERSLKNNRILLSQRSQSLLAKLTHLLLD